MLFLKNRIFFKIKKSSKKLTLKSFLLSSICGIIISLLFKGYVKKWEYRYYRTYVVDHSLEIKKQSLEGLEINQIQEQPILNFLTNRTAFIFESQKKPNVNFKTKCSKCNSEHQHNFDMSSDQSHNKKDNDPSRLPKRGMGCFISKDGHILTAKHVVFNNNEPSKNIWLAYYDGKQKRVEKAEVIWSSQTQDLVLLKSSYQPINWFNLAKSKPMKNTKVIAGGYYPYKGEINYIVSKGSISNIGVNKKSKAKINTVILHNAPTIPGDSGGPLMDEQGALIGVHSKMIMNKSLLGAVFNKVDSKRLIKTNIAEPVLQDFIHSITDPLSFN